MKIVTACLYFHDSAYGCVEVSVKRNVKKIFFYDYNFLFRGFFFALHLYDCPAERSRWDAVNIF